MEFTVSHDCIMCRRKFAWEETMIIKTPEGVCFCIECAAKYPDPKVYDGDIDSWLVHPYRGPEKYEYIEQSDEHEKV